MIICYTKSQIKSVIHRQAPWNILKWPWSPTFRLNIHELKHLELWIADQDKSAD